MPINKGFERGLIKIFFYEFFFMNVFFGVDGAGASRGLGKEQEGKRKKFPPWGLGGCFITNILGV